MTKRSDGRYQAQVTIGEDEYGRRIRKTVYGKTKAECQRKVDELKTSIGQGIDLVSAESTFGEFSSLYLRSIEDRLTENNFSRKSANLKQFTDVIGNIPINKIKPLHIQPILNDLAKKNPYTHQPSAYKTLVTYRDICSQVFKFAIMNRAITYNPCEYVTLHTTKQTKTRRALSKTEIANLEQCESYGKYPALISVFCGLRRGEMTALTWNDVDFSNNVININKSYDFKTSTIKSPKTVSGIRSVPIPDKLLPYLLKMQKSAKNSLVLGEYGKYLNEKRWTTMLNNLLAEMEEKFGKNKHTKSGDVILAIEPFDYHCCRHTYATMLYSAGVPITVGKELLGHSDISTTMKVYTHIEEETKQISIAKLNDFMSNI